MHRSVVETIIGAVVLADNAVRLIWNVFSRWPAEARQVFFVIFDLFEIRYMVRPSEAVGRIQVGAAPFGG